VSGYKSALITLCATILLSLFAAPAMEILPDKYAGVSVYGIALWSVVEGLLTMVIKDYSEDVLCIPTDSIRKDEEGKYVFVREGSENIRRNVSTAQVLPIVSERLAAVTSAAVT